MFLNKFSNFGSFKGNVLSRVNTMRKRLGRRGDDNDDGFKRVSSQNVIPLAEETDDNSLVSEHISAREGHESSRGTYQPPNLLEPTDFLTKNERFTFSAIKQQSFDQVTLEATKVLKRLAEEDSVETEDEEGKF